MNYQPRLYHLKKHHYKNVQIVFPAQLSGFSLSIMINTPLTMIINIVQVMGSMGHERVRMAGVNLARSLDLGILGTLSASYWARRFFFYRCC
jgi:hypothetical protein